MAKAKETKYKPNVTLSSTTVAANSRAIRTHNNLSIEGVAAEMKISKSTLSELELGKREWTIEEVQKNAVALSVEPTVLLATGPGVMVDSVNNSPGAYYSNRSNDETVIKTLQKAVETLQSLAEQQISFMKEFMNNKTK